MAINGLLRDDLREVTVVLLLEVILSVLKLLKTSPKIVLNRVYLCANFLLVENGYWVTVATSSEDSVFIIFML